MPVPTPVLRIHVTTRPAIDSDPPYEREAAPEEGGPRFLGSLALAVATAPVLARPELVLVPRLVPTLLPPAAAQATTPATPVDTRADELFGVVPTRRAELPAPGPRARVLVRAIIEALSGRRSLGQLVPWVTSDVYDELEVSIAPDRGRGWAARTCRLIVSEPADGVAEVAAVVQRGQRATAIALRMEGRDGRWVVTAVQMA